MSKTFQQIITEWKDRTTFVDEVMNYIAEGTPEYYKWLASQMGNIQKVKTTTSEELDRIAGIDSHEYPYEPVLPEPVSVLKLTKNEIGTEPVMTSAYQTAIDAGLRVWEGTIHAHTLDVDSEISPPAHTPSQPDANGYYYSWIPPVGTAGITMTAKTKPPTHHVGDFHHPGYERIPVQKDLRGLTFKYEYLD